MHLTDIVNNVSSIAVEAGRAIMEIYENTTDLEIQSKADQSPLTIADQKSNEIICDGLDLLNERYPIISEENKEVPYSERCQYESYWLVDPLDGTKEFIKRNGEFTVNIALINQQKPILGVVYAPVLKELYWAVKGEGAYVKTNQGIRRLKALDFSMSDSHLKVVCSRSHLNKSTQSFIDGLNLPDLVARGSSLKFLILADGAAHVYPRLGPTMEWDTAAAHIILEEAGGQIIDEQTKAPLLYNKENLLNPHFIAYGNVNLSPPENQRNHYHIQ